MEEVTEKKKRKERREKVRMRENDWKREREGEKGRMKKWEWGLRILRDKWERMVESKISGEKRSGRDLEIENVEREIEERMEIERMLKERMAKRWRKVRMAGECTNRLYEVRLESQRWACMWVSLSESVSTVREWVYYINEIY